jgi:apolipoprotein N-acyltransferase
VNVYGKFFLDLLAAAATGVGMVLLFPPYHASWLVWVVFAPVLGFLWTLGPKRRFLKSFSVGGLAGTVGFLGIFSWLRTVTDLGWVIVSMYLALFPAFWAAFVGTLADPRRDPRGNNFAGSIRRAFWVAAMWCGLEWLRGWLFTGFGWNGIGVAFHDTPLFAQSADLFGVIGLSFLPVFVQTVAVQVLMRMFSKEEVNRSQPHYDLAVAVCLIAAAVGYGRWRVSSYGKRESVRLKTLMVQLNIPQDAHNVGWKPEEIHMGYEDETSDALHDLPANRKPDWVIWPESALSGRVLRMPDQSWGMAEENFETLRRVHEDGGDFTTIMGLVEVEGEMLGDQMVIKEDSRFWNSMAIFPPDGGLKTFRKHHLVIFGEYIPFVDRFPFLAKIYEQQSGEKFMGGFSRGESLDPLPLKVGSNEVEMIPTVCFEDSVGRLVRKFTRDAPQVIVNVTNDGWFKESIGAEQHFANARFRAIELRRPLVRCANSGVTAAVDTLGLTRNPDTGKHQELRDAKGSTFLRGHLFADIDVPKHPQWTLYSVIGDWGVIGAALVAWVWAMFVGWHNRAAAREPVAVFG